jgi:hypothetical protein
MGISRTPSLATKYGSGMDISSSPSPERKYSFGMGISPSPSPEPKDHFKSNFGFHEPLFLPDPEDDFETQVPVSPLPHAEDFGITPPVPDEGPSQTDTHQPTEAKGPIGSSSKKRGEFHIAASNKHLTLVYTAWIWGERAPSPSPSPTDDKQEGQPSAIGPDDLTDELVC